MEEWIVSCDKPKPYWRYNLFHSLLFCIFISFTEILDKNRESKIIKLYFGLA